MERKCTMPLASISSRALSSFLACCRKRIFMPCQKASLLQRPLTRYFSGIADDIIRNQRGIC